MNASYLSLVFSVLFFVFSTPLIGQNKVQVKGVDGAGEVKLKKTSVMDWMMNPELDESPEEVSLSLVSDFDQFKAARKTQEYQVAVVSIESGGETLSLEAEIKPRGKFRCMRCDMPPVKLKFYKDTLKEVGLSKMNELKIVLPCKVGEQYDQYLYKEFLTYRLYNVLTDRSFRVKQIGLNIECTKTGEKVENIEAFVIEHEEELVKRINGKALDTSGVGPAAFSEKDYRRLQVFQFMIGNTDWIPATEHNFELIKIKNEKGLVPVPFDFDFSGLVGTDYAVPNSMTNIANVQERFFMGNGMTEAELEETFDLFRDKRIEMIMLIQDFEPLDKKEKKKMIKYIESFFDIIDSSKEVKEYFVDRPPFMAEIY